MPKYDLIIRNGTICDGTGRAMYKADVAVNGGLIAAVQCDLEGTTEHEINAAGKIVTPGFVDVHTHYDGQATWDAHLSPSSNMGTTTVVLGNCGVGFAPCKPEDHDVLIEVMEGVEEIPGSVMNEGLPWTWESFPEFLDTLDSMPRDIDVAALFPHTPLRVYVMGERGVNREPANADDIEQMKMLVKEGLDAGAVGFSTSRTAFHYKPDGEHIPTYDAASTELKAIGETLSGDKGQVFQMVADFHDLDDEFSIVEETSKKTGAKGTFGVAYISSRPELWRTQLERIEAAQSLGIDICAQVITRPIGMMMGLRASMHPYYRRPSFMELDGLDLEEKINLLKQPERKARILSEKNINAHVFVRSTKNHFERMYVFEEPLEYLPEYEHTVAARAAKDGEDPDSWLYDYLVGSQGKPLIYIPAANMFDDIPSLLRHPHTVPALGDGGAHVGTICDSSAYLYLITKWVQEESVFELPVAIHMLTRKPSELYSLLDRGIIAPKMKADINILDFEKLKLNMPHVVNDLPGGGIRFMQEVDGIEATFVSGELIYKNGQATGVLPGKLVRGCQKDARI